jgi:tRNA(Ile2) C34 agmatinyltransferase TiaS
MMAKNSRNPPGHRCPDCQRDISGKAHEPGGRCNWCYERWRKQNPPKKKYKDSALMTLEELDALVAERYPTMPQEPVEDPGSVRRLARQNTSNIRIYPDTRGKRR